MILADMHQMRPAMRPGVRTMLAGGLSGGLRGAGMARLIDPFDALDSAKWAATNSNGTVSIASSKLDLTTTGAAGSYALITSVSSYDFRGSEAYVKVVRPFLGTTDADGARTVFRIVASDDPGDYVEWFVQTDGIVVARTVADGGAPTDNANIHGDWATSGFSWLKLSLSGGTATWWTAPDNSGSPGTWTSRRTNSTLPSSFASSKAMLFVDNWGTGHGAITQSAQFDGFNTVAA